MKKHLSSAAAALVLIAGTGIAAAQTVIVQPEQEVVIREYVQKQPLASIDLPGLEINIGSKLPETVELYRMEVPDVQYNYVVVGGRTLLVDPVTREVVHVLD